MSTVSKQHRFTQMVARLLLHAEALGYQVTFGDAYRDPRCPYGSKRSMHHKRLAIDLNLFKNGHYLTDTYDHLPLGEYWESIGGIWGGRFSNKDGNHYQYGELEEEQDDD